MHLTKITVCGGGNGAQTLVPIAAHNLGCPVDVYAPFADEAQRLRAGIAAHGGLEVHGAVQAQARPRRVSADPAEVIPGSEVVVLVLPAFAHEATLRQIAPFLDESAWVGAIPARGGFDYCAAWVLAELGRPDVRLFGLQTLPWACRIEEYGQVVHVLGVKEAVDAASRPAAEIGAIVPLLERMLGLRIGRGSQPAGPDPGQHRPAHPSRHHVRSLCRLGWRTLGALRRLFYQGLERGGCPDVLAGLSDDVQAIRARLEEALDLSAVRPLKDWLLRSYGDAIADPSSLRSAFVTNRAYAGLKAPVREVAPGPLCARFRRPLPGRGCALWPGRQPGDRRPGRAWKRRSWTGSSPGPASGWAKTTWAGMPARPASRRTTVGVWRMLVTTSGPLRPRNRE